MKVEIEIKDEDIIDALCTALEGGSNYWYYMPNIDDVDNIDGKSSAECVIIHAIDGYSPIIVQDIETEELLGVISTKSIRKGLELFINNGHAFDPVMDAGDADTLFQFIIMGEIVYG